MSVTIRGTNPIDSTTLDDNDLRLVNQAQTRTKLRLVNFALDQASGVVTATYRVNLGLLAGDTFGVRAIHDQVRDDQGIGNFSRQIGTIAL